MQLIDYGPVMFRLNYGRGEVSPYYKELADAHFALNALAAYGRHAAYFVQWRNPATGDWIKRPQDQVA